MDDELAGQEDSYDVKDATVMAAGEVNEPHGLMTAEPVQHSQIAHAPADPHERSADAQRLDDISAHMPTEGSTSGAQGSLHPSHADNVSVNSHQPTAPEEQKYSPLETQGDNVPDVMARAVLSLQQYSVGPQIQASYADRDSGAVEYTNSYQIPLQNTVGTLGDLERGQLMQQQHHDKSLNVLQQMRRRASSVNPGQPGIDDAVIAALTKMHGLPAQTTATAASNTSTSGAEDVVVPHPNNIAEVMQTPSTHEIATPTQSMAAPLTLQEDNDGSSSVQVQEEKWVQCDACSKWRLVPQHIDMNSISKSAWTCNMATWDATLATAGCAVPEASTQYQDQDADDDAQMEPQTSPLPTPSTSFSQRSISAVSERGKKKHGRDRVAGRSPLIPAASPVGYPGQPTTPSFAAQTTTQKRKKRPRTEVQWVQCDACSKWRKLARGIVTTEELPDVWNCNMNWWDPTRAFCDAPEETADDSEVVLPAEDASNTFEGGAPADGVEHNEMDDEMEAQPTRKRRRFEHTASSSNKIPSSPPRPLSKAASTDNSTTAKAPIDQIYTCTELPVPGTIAAEFPQAAYLSRDRKGALPSYITGVRDYHYSMLLHPPEVWGTPTAGRNPMNDQIKAAWSAASAVGPTISVPTGQAAKISYRDLISTSWMSRNRNVSQAGERSLSARESHLRWCRSSVYAAPMEAVSIAANDTPAEADLTIASARRSAAACNTMSHISTHTMIKPVRPRSRDTQLSARCRSILRYLTQHTAVHQLEAEEADVRRSRNNTTSDNSNRNGTLRAIFRMVEAAISSGSEPERRYARSDTLSVHSLGFHSARLPLLMHAAGISSAAIAAVDVQPSDVLIAALPETARWTPASRAIDAVIRTDAENAVQADIEAQKRYVTEADVRHQAYLQKRAERAAQLGVSEEELEEAGTMSDAEFDAALVEELVEESLRGDLEKRVGTGRLAEPAYLAYRGTTSVLAANNRETALVLLTLLIMYIDAKQVKESCSAEGEETDKPVQGGLTAAEVTQMLSLFVGNTAPLYALSGGAFGVGMHACEARLKALTLRGFTTLAVKPGEHHAEDVYALQANLVGDITSSLKMEGHSDLPSDVSSMVAVLCSCVKHAEMQSAAQETQPSALLPPKIAKPWKIRSLALQPVDNGRFWTENVALEIQPIHADV